MSLELAEAFIQAGELDNALAALSQHLDQQPEAANARRLRVDVLLRLLGRARDALADLDRLENDDPLLRYQALESIGDHEAAFIVIERNYRQSPVAQYGPLLLRLLYQRAEPDAALHLLATLPKTWFWLGWSGDCCALKGDFLLALEHFCSALEDLRRTPENALADIQRAALLLKRADAYSRLKRWPDAEADYRAAALLVPNDPSIPFNHGVAIYESGDLRRALPLCRDALDHAPDALRDEMRKALMDEPHYRVLAQALLG